VRDLNKAVPAARKICTPSVNSAASPRIRGRPRKAAVDPGCRVNNKRWVEHVVSHAVAPNLRIRTLWLASERAKNAKEQDRAILTRCSAAPSTEGDGTPAPLRQSLLRVA
jgi:hypothetical protein